jgi:hypothetical protein
MPRKQPLKRPEDKKRPGRSSYSDEDYAQLDMRQGRAQEVAEEQGLTPKGKRYKPTRLEMNKRVATIAKLLVAGMTTFEIELYASDKWGYGSAQARSLIAEARARIEDDWDLERKQYAAQILAEANWVQREARRTGQLSNMLGAINIKCKIVGLGTNTLG